MLRFGGQGEREEKECEGGGEKRREELKRGRQLTVRRKRREDLVVARESKGATVEEGNVATKVVEMGGDGCGVEAEEERTEVRVMAVVQSVTRKTDGEQIARLLFHRTLHVREEGKCDRDSGGEE